MQMWDEWQDSTKDERPMHSLGQLSRITDEKCKATVTIFRERICERTDPKQQK